MLAKCLDRFLRQTDGAVTVDWVVLTGLVVGLALAAVGQFNTVVQGVAQNIATTMSTLL